MRTLYVVGLPGSGKSTLMKAIIDRHGATGVHVADQPVPHLRYHADGRDLGLWEIGRRRESFSGTDALAMNINPRAIAWVQMLGETGGPTWLLGEGDRLALVSFLAACPNLTVVHLDTPPDVARERATARAATLGVPPQAEAWWKGRATKVRNLMAAVTPMPSVTVTTLDGTAETGVLADVVVATMGR